MQASVLSWGSQRPSPMCFAFDAPQAASKTASAGSAQLSKGPRPVAVEGQQSPKSKPQPSLFSAASQTPSPKRPRAAVCAAGHVGLLESTSVKNGERYIAWKAEPWPLLKISNLIGELLPELGCEAPTPTDGDGPEDADQRSGSRISGCPRPCATIGSGRRPA